MKSEHPLLKIAQNQAGLFTSHQAIKAGIDSRNHAYHLKSGNWSRVEKGLYQLNQIPVPYPKRDFFLFQLLTRNRKGEPVGAFSYETALYLMGLQTSYPKRFHITVPHSFRRSLSKDQLVLHYEELSNTNKIQLDNLNLTSAKKTFQNLFLSGTYHPEWIKQNLKTAMRKKLLSLEEIKTISVPQETKTLFNAILFELLD